MERMSQPLQISLSHYERLGVSSSADPETLRQAFRRRSKDLHPDTTMLPAEEAAIQFQLLRESYELLADPERRRVYDEQRTSAPALSSQPLQRADRDGWHGIGQRRPLSGGEWLIHGEFMVDKKRKKTCSNSEVPYYTPWLLNSNNV